MLSEKEMKTLKENIERYEGRVPHLYLDSRGFVTVGVGHLLSSVENAKALDFVTMTGELATENMIAEEYQVVSTREANRVASYYQSFTQLRLSDSAIDQLTVKHIDSFYGELKIIYSEFDSFPSDIKLALFDLIFNLGMTSLRKKWPKFNGCIASKDWVAAADNCRRKGIADERNEYVKALLLSGANIDIA
jgi:GH24 family phage-related lysozyme (muramidase)